MTQTPTLVRVSLAMLLGFANVGASPPRDLSRLFSKKAPYEFPHLQRSAELERAAEDAIRDYRERQPKLKLALTGIYHDPQRGLAFLTFGIAKDSPVFETDFLLVYVYDRSAHRLVGHVFIAMA